MINLKSFDPFGSIKLIEKVVSGLRGERRTINCWNKEENVSTRVLKHNELGAANKYGLDVVCFPLIFVSTFYASQQSARALNSPCFPMLHT